MILKAVNAKADKDFRGTGDRRSESEVTSIHEDAREPGSGKFPRSQPQDRGGTWVLARYGLLLILVLDFTLNNHLSYLSIYLGKMSLQNMPGLSIYSLNWLHTPTETKRKFQVQPQWTKKWGQKKMNYIKHVFLHHLKLAFSFFKLFIIFLN